MTTAINDTLGHPVGDEALVAAASILTRSMVGRKGILARYGGDEFLAMLFLADEAEADAYRQSVKAGLRVLQPGARPALSPGRQRGLCAAQRGHGAGGLRERRRRRAVQGQARRSVDARRAI